MKTRAFRIGAAFGGLLGILIAFGMDKLSGDVPGGGWVGAVAHDFNLPPSGAAAIAIAILVVLIMVIISAGLGGLCGLALERFFKIFTQE
jgi:hypothetical protein